MTYIPSEALPLTAFGDLRVAELSPIMQVNFAYTVTNTEIGMIETTTGGSVTQGDGMCVVSIDGTSGATAEWETARHAKYRAGLGGLFRGTAMFTTGVANSEQMLGLADTEGTGLGVGASHMNGFGVGFSGTTFGFMRWYDDALTLVAQSAWDDPMDGTGASGMTLDPTKLNVYFIEFQYLGAGAITLWIESDITGLPVKAHTVHYTNQNVVPSVMNPNFHLMLHIVNNATTTALTAKSASIAYFVEGETKYTEILQPQFATGNKQKTGVTTEEAVFSIKVKGTYASKTNFMDIVLERVAASIDASNNNIGNLRLVRDPTFTGTAPVWVDIDTTDSIVQVDVTADTISGGKEVMDIEFAGGNDRAGENLTPYDIILVPDQVITLAATSSTSATVNGSLLWKELF